MARPLVIVGGGGMGRCVMDLVDAINTAAGDADHIEMVGVVDDGRPNGELWRARQVEVLGGIDVLERLPADVEYVIAIASTSAKDHIDQRLRGSRSSPVLVHPNVHRGFDVQLGPGSLVCSHVSMENHIRVGRHVHVNQNSTIGHDCVIGDYVTVSPLAAVSGAVRVDEGAFLGTGSSIIQGLSIGACATVGAGAAVISDVAAELTVVGVPAREAHGSTPREAG